MNIQTWMILFALAVLGACQNQYRTRSASDTERQLDSAVPSGRFDGESFQVSVDEYRQNFESRFGLLFLKTSKVPFSGRILTVDVGENGEFVSTDESWKDGRKNGKSSKWFSNGVKMYERNYQKGKWHGTVTRWWPNGQKMYVRAYSFGARHGKEATWRSDGTPIILPSDGVPPAYTSSESSDNFNQSSTTTSSDSLDSLDIEPSIGIEEDVDSSPGEDFSADEVPSFTALDDLPATDAPVDEKADESLPEPSLDFESLPPLATDLPQSEKSLSDSPELPQLEPTPSDQAVEFGELPPLASEDEQAFPPLPAADDAGVLPPLPGGDEDLGELPPLPPLP